MNKQKLELLESVLNPIHTHIPDKNIYEYQAILDDQAVLAQLNLDHNKMTQNWFVLDKHGQIKPNSRLKSSDACIFRSDSIGIVYSDIVAIDKNCIMLEVSNEKNTTRLMIEPGRKNISPVDISLYRESGLLERIQLQKRMSWNLDGFEPGDYRLLLGKNKSFQFVIQE